MSRVPLKRQKSAGCNEDFVSYDVNQALQEARLIVTKGKHSNQPNENLIEESTTVKVNNYGTNDPLEVFISHSTTATQEKSDDEVSGSYSDSEIRRHSRSGSKRSRVNGAKSDHDISKLSEDDIDKSFMHHTNAKYRKKQDELWTRDDSVLDNIQLSRLEPLETEARLEVDVTEECREIDGGGHVLIKTWEAKWTVTTFDALPDWMKDNEYILTGHRPPLPSAYECFKSIFAVHTETGNIWTHLIGCLAFFFLAVWFLTRPDMHIQFQEKLVFSFFFLGAILCLGLSFVFHTLSCHSVPVLNLFSKLDYTGISLLIVGSFIPWIYYGFYCRREPKITYIALICVLGIAAIVVSLWDKFNESRFRALRAGVFVGMGCSGIIPAVHFVYTDGMKRLIDENGFYWLLTMASFYLLGAFLYATRIPERFFVGKCDLIFQSHQLFHLCVVVAAFIHYYGISEMAMNKLTSECPVEGIVSSRELHTEL